MTTPDEAPESTPTEPDLAYVTAFEDAMERMRRRFFSAVTSGPPTEPQKLAVIRIRELVIDLAAQIEVDVPTGRNKSIALTALEDVAMRANRGIFDPVAAAERAEAASLQEQVRVLKRKLEDVADVAAGASGVANAAMNAAGRPR